MRKWWPSMNKKWGKELTRENVIRFSKASKQSEALHAYVEELMDRYHVRINEKALEQLSLSKTVN